MQDHNYEEFNPERETHDETPLYPYQDFYESDSCRKRRKHGGGGGGWIVLLLVLAVSFGIGWFFSEYSVDLRQTSSGYMLAINPRSEAVEPPQEDVPPADIIPPGDVQPATEPAEEITPAHVGTGTELAVSSAPGELPATVSYVGQGMSLQEIYKKVSPSVVSIISNGINSGATGTGIVMSEDGYVITNHHVVESAVAVQVLTADDIAYEANLVGSDETSDLAVLKIDVSGLTPAEFGDSDQLVVGDAVVAIGDPLGTQLRGTMTDGIISAINRDLTVNGRSMTLLQTNAALNSGNSGGPLINAYGQVIGINTMKMSSYYSAASVEGLGFAIPIATAKPIIDELLAQGYVSGRPALGISGKSLPSSAMVYYRLPMGVYVESVAADSDAYAKGIQTGDIITAINGTPVSTSEELNLVKNEFKAGETVNLTVYRNEKYYEVSVVLMDASQY